MENTRMDRPDLSIIIPYYKGMDRIEETVSYVKTVSHSREILIINDGSGSDEYEKLCSLFSDDQGIVLYDKPNGGIADTRNFGLDHAHGRYLVFCDQDDKPVSGVIDQAVNRADAENDDIVFWSTEMIYDADRPNKDCDTVLSNKTIEGDEIKNGLLKQILTQSSSEYGTRFAHLWMGLYRRDFLKAEQIRFKSFISIDDDLIFIMDAVSYAGRIGLIPKTGYLWLQNYGSRSHTTGYIRDFVNKTTAHFDYYETVMERSGCSAETREAVTGFTRQALVADSLVNWSDIPSGTEKDEQKRQIMTILKSDDQLHAWDEYRMNKDARRYRTFCLLKRGMREGAFIYNATVKNIRVFKHRGRLIYDGARAKLKRRNG